MKEYRNFGLVMDRCLKPVVVILLIAVVALPSSALTPCRRNFRDSSNQCKSDCFIAASRLQEAKRAAIMAASNCQCLAAPQIVISEALIAPDNQAAPFLQGQDAATTGALTTAPATNNPKVVPAATPSPQAVLCVFRI